MKSAATRPSFLSLPLDQSETPLLDALYHCARRPNAPFHTPGHKRGQGIGEPHRRLFGSTVFRADLSELPGLDNLFAPEGVILRSQALAAEAFGAEHTWFLANGSTGGIEAAILATCGPGDTLILPRNVHSSAIAGLVLSGAMPVYLSPLYSHDWQMPIAVSPAAVEAALRQHPEAKAVLVVSPTYHGMCSDLAAIAQITHRQNIPLIVDEAHAPHFAFHPDLPPSALASGADIAIQSAHKVLSAFTQSAMLHAQGDRLDPSRLSQCLQLTQSTSPSYLLLGSLDGARHQMATTGKKLMSQTLALANRASEALAKLPGLRVLQPQAGDRTRITVEISGLGISGFEADELLHTQCQVTAELPALQHLMFIVSLGNTAADITQLIDGFAQLCQRYPSDEVGVRVDRLDHEELGGLKGAIAPKHPAISPRMAFFGPKIAVPMDQAVGRICAETVCPYPPGIPTLLPGEPISAEAIAHLQSVLSAGGTITGCQDHRLATLLTVKS